MQKKKKRQLPSAAEQKAASAGVRGKLKKLPKKTMLLMLELFLLFSVTYYVLNSMMILWATPVLYISATVVFLLFFILNRGFTRDPISEDVLNEAWSREKKQRFIEKDIRKKAMARKLMVVMVPLLLLVAMDILLVVIYPILTA